jgi:hypothetical protein
MNEELKFAEVFVDLTENGKEMNNPSNISYRLDLAKDQYKKYKSNWENFLQAKKKELSELEFEQWFEDLVFEKLSFNDLSEYKLPLEKIEVDGLYGLSALLDISNILKDSYKKLENVITDNENFLIVCDINDYQLFLELIILDNSNKQLISKTKHIIKSDLDKIVDILKSTFNQHISINYAYLSYTKQSMTKIDPKCSLDEKEEREHQKEVLDKNNVTFFRIIQITNDTFMPARSNNDSIDVEEYINELLSKIPQFYACNNEDKDEIFNLV